MLCIFAAVVSPLWGICNRDEVPGCGGFLGVSPLVCHSWDDQMSGQSVGDVENVHHDLSMVKCPGKVAIGCCIHLRLNEIFLIQRINMSHTFVMLIYLFKTAGVKIL